MIGLILAVVIAVVQNGTQWEVTFAPHSLNVGVNLVTVCKNDTNHLVFRAVDFIPVEPEAQKVVSRRQDRLPARSNCEMNAEVIRNSNGATGAPDGDYVGESAVVTWVEK